MHEIISPGIAWLLNQGALAIVAAFALAFAHMERKRSDSKDLEIKELNKARVEEMKLALKTIGENTTVLEDARDDYDRLRDQLRSSEAA